MVLDDVHLLTEPAILDGLAYVLRNARTGLHLVIASRADPLLPLHQYRLTEELTEIRADDLAFSAPESAVLLAHHGVTLSAAALECLTSRMEGWAAGVRLAALSLHRRQDPEQFVKEMDAENSAITGYLVDEVLNAQPPSVRDLLLRTSILDYISTDLARELVDDQPAQTPCQLWRGQTRSSGRSGTGGTATIRCSARYCASNSRSNAITGWPICIDVLPGGFSATGTSTRPCVMPPNPVTAVRSPDGCG